MSPRLASSNPVAFAALALSIAAALSACSGGGGGSNVRPNTPPPSPPPVTYSYPAYNHLVPTGVLAAQQGTACGGHGCTGSGVSVGILDSGIDPSLADMQGRIIWFQGYGPNNVYTTSTPNDSIGHGSMVAQILGGSAAGGYPGGVAPGASLYFAQVCTPNGGTGACVTYSRAYTDMTGLGVHVFNQSFGELESTYLAAGGDMAYTEQQIDQEFGGYVGQNVFVWAAGNEPANSSDISTNAIAPAYYVALQPAWLAVVNVQVNGAGQVTTLDPSSAQCGGAAEWCLAAPGTDIALGIPNTQFAGGGGDGTSFAAPIVTGTVALVWQAYPWMTPANLTDTVLTTATPLGTGPYPNAVYGWGLVNAGKAVQGPAQFAFGAFDANIGSYSSTFANAIGGTGSLDLTGTTGTLTLTGANTYSGGTSVQSGNLWLSGSLASSVAVNGGSFGGDGTVNGNVTNAGTVTSQAPVGGAGLTIAGNYTAQAASTTAIALGNPLTVDGSASLAGILEILAPATTYTPASTETLMNYGSETGRFGSQTDGAGVFWTVSNLAYGSKALTASVTASSVAQTAARLAQANAVTMAAAQGVQGALTQANGWLSAPSVTGITAAHAGFLHNTALFMSARTAAQANASLQSLSGEIYGTSRALEFQQAGVTDQALAARQNDLSLGARPGVWVQGTGASGALAQAGTSTAHYDLGGGLIGIDAPIAHGLSAGVAAGQSNLDASLDGLAGRVDGRESVFAAYARWNLADGTYLAGRASRADERVNVERSVLLGNTVQSVAGSRSDTITRATLEGGKSYRVAGGELTPYASLTGERVDQAAFTEQGASGFGLASPAQSHTAMLADLGLRYGRSFTWVGGRSTLSGEAAYERVLSGANLGFEAAFAGTPTALFTAQGQDLARNTTMVGLELNTRVDHHWGWFLDLGAQFARGRMQGKTATAGVRIHW